MAGESLRRSDYAPVLESKIAESLDHSPLPLEKLLERPLENPQKISLGNFWPTFYHLALEEHHPGPEVAVHGVDGKAIARASASFLKQVSWQGSGISRQGLRLHYAGRPNRFEIYPERIWGYGAGRNFTVLPYRTLAVNLPGICARLGRNWKNCRSKDVLGLMVFIPQIADKKIKMPGGSIHDGAFCLTDTGAPSYIREDRIDIFTGAHGGGNPYLPPARRGNAFIAGGINALVPSDWRLWNSLDERVFCKNSDLPENSRPGRASRCDHDYHTTAWQKRLELMALYQNGRPLLCRSGL
jgi:hypothetical protein